jgi:hypothetical protein
VLPHVGIVRKRLGFLANGMGLSPVLARDWTDPAWDVAQPTGEDNVLTISRLKNGRGRGKHKVSDPVLIEFFVSLAGSVMDKLPANEQTKLGYDSFREERPVVKSLFVTINQCTVRCPLPVAPPTVGDSQCSESRVLLVRRPRNGSQICK